MLEYRHVRILTCWNIDMLEYKRLNIDILAYRCRQKKKFVKGSKPLIRVTFSNVKILLLLEPVL